MREHTPSPSHAHTRTQFSLTHTYTVPLSLPQSQTYTYTKRTPDDTDELQATPTIHPATAALWAGLALTELLPSSRLVENSISSAISWFFCSQSSLITLSFWCSWSEHTHTRHDTLWDVYLYDKHNLSPGLSGAAGLTHTHTHTHAHIHAVVTHTRTHARTHAHTHTHTRTHCDIYMAETQNTVLSVYFS